MSNQRLIRRFWGCWIVFGICVLVTGIIAITWAVEEYYYVSEARVTYSGAINGAYTSDVNASCGHFGKNFAISFSEDWNRWENSYIHLYLSHQLEAGTHSLKLKTMGSDLDTELSLGYSVLSGYIFEQGEAYFLDSGVEVSEKYISGTLSLNEIPDRPRKPIRGEFEIMLTDLELRGEFEFRTKSDANYDCLQ